ncbi:hypothetical protein VPNG_03312 [Cytospora leucostoma]|uniref:DUF7729 domain-containing protein n=1 Tax=Cytospora leucostoma TaxID=1230097 RepID=A0A423XFW6_9PEZI|nr:hypothetical protein VPNG_03312 [Cytospora leucostoma]
MTTSTTLFGNLTVREAAALRASNSSTARYHRPRIQWAAALCLAASLTSHALATPILAELPEPTAAPDLAETLLLDTQVPALLDHGMWTMLEPAELRRRASVASSVTTTFEITVPSTTSGATSTDDSGLESPTDAETSVSASATTSTVTATTSSSSLPSPFDGGLSNNFTTKTCPTFINDMLADAEFQACYPVSLLIQSSQSFFDAQKSLVSMTTVLDHACQANATRCTTYLASTARNLTASSACAADYAAGNPVAVEAYLGLVAYPVLYSATCLKDADGTSGVGAYCFADAVTNTTNPTEAYFYHLPLNTSLPGGTVPVCASCLRDTMGIYQVAAANRRQPVAYTYAAAAAQVNTLCGPGFVNETLPDAIVSSSGAGASGVVVVGAARGGSTWALLFATCLLAVVVNCVL